LSRRRLPQPPGHWWLGGDNRVRIMTGRLVESPRDDFMLVAEKELIAFERRERELRKQERKERAEQVACPRTSKLGGAWGQPPAAITNPPAKHVTAAMKRAISDGVNVQSLRMLRLNCWTIPATQRFFETLKNG
jgi:hypothetical protein